MIDGSFRQDTTFREFKGDVPTAIVPHVFVNYHAPASKAAWGLGIYVPYGLTSQWTDDFPGRFSAKKASLQTTLPFKGRPASPAFQTAMRLESTRLI